MICIYCKKETEVTNSRPKMRTPSVWRRRACLDCKQHFTSIELPDYEKALRVLGSTRKALPFSRDKLFLSLYKSLGHRSDALSSATALTATVIGRLLTKNPSADGTLNPRAIAKVSLEALKRFDPLAAATYKAYHQTALK
jgi:transcriptional repressor NrdR